MPSPCSYASARASCSAAPAGSRKGTSGAGGGSARASPVALTPDAATDAANATTAVTARSRQASAADRVLLHGAAHIDFTARRIQRGESFVPRQCIGQSIACGPYGVVTQEPAGLADVRLGVADIARPEIIVLRDRNR